MSDQQNRKGGRDAFYAALTAYVQVQEREGRQRRARWAIVIVAMLGYMAFNVWYAISSGEVSPSTSNYAAAVRIDGPIQTGKLASTNMLFPVLEKAFTDKQARCVALVINSPGGTVAQSEMLHDRVLKLAKQHDKKVVAVGEDLMASGGYLIAVSAEKIYAPRMSAVGSIGVRQDGYDLTGIADKLGIKDRTLTAGRMKDANNPLKPLSKEAEDKARHDLQQIHDEFKRLVRESRGGRIKAADGEIFTGEVFTGFDGYKLGLLDGHLDLEDAVKAECGADGVKMFTPSIGLADVLAFISGY